MKKLNAVLVLIFILCCTVVYAENVTMKTMELKLLKVKSHSSFEFEQIGYCRLAGVSAPRFDDAVFAKAKKEVENILNSLKNTEGKIKLQVQKSESTGKNGKKYTRYYIVIPTNKDISVNEYLIKKGIVYTNKYTKDYFDLNKAKAYENEAKEKKLYKWADK